MASPFFPLAGCEASATETQTAIAAGFMRLFKSGFAPDATTPRADYLTNEADYTGYTAGGEPVAAWNDPILGPGSSFQINSPLVQFETDDPTTTGNLIGGMWFEDANNVIRYAVIFDEPISMDQPNQGIPLTIVWPFPSGQ